MWTFIVAGAVYLIGVGVILVIRPSFMFTPVGDWKEFGIGQREDRYTPFPFWLFCLVWALVAYFLVLMVMTATGFDEVRASVASRKNRPTLNSVDEGETVDLEQPQKLPKGYYVLNKKASRMAGVPKYVYLGEE